MSKTDLLNTCLKNKGYTYELDETSNWTGKALYYVDSSDFNNLFSLFKNYSEFINVNAAEDRMLITACDEGNIDIVKLLVKHGAKINARNSTPLLFAINSNSKNVVSYLLSLNVKTDQTHLTAAIENRCVNVVEMLLSQTSLEPSVENLRFTLNIANKELLDVFLWFGFFRRRPEVLQFAVDMFNYDLIYQLFTEYQFTANNYLGDIILQKSSEKNNVSLVRTLFSTDYKMSQEAGEKALETATNLGSTEFVILLLEEGVIDINKTNVGYIAIREDYIDIFNQLVNHGLDITQNKNYVRCAVETNNLSILKLLLNPYDIEESTQEESTLTTQEEDQEWLQEC